MGESCLEMMEMFLQISEVMTSGKIVVGGPFSVSTLFLGQKFGNLVKSHKILQHLCKTLFRPFLLFTVCTSYGHGRRLLVPRAGLLRAVSSF